MISSAEFSALTARFPILKQLPPPLRDALREQSLVVDAPRGTVLFDEGSSCQNFLLIVAGSVKVAKSADGRREILLYRLLPSETCVLTLNCLLGHTNYPARGIVEEQLHAVALPMPLFERLVAEAPLLRREIFASLGERVAILIGLVEQVAFHRLDQRLAALLLRLLDGAPESKGGRGPAGPSTLNVTHQSLADDLGSVREIVSRLLESFAEQGAVELSRGRVTVVRRDALEQIASPR